VEVPCLSFSPVYLVVVVLLPYIICISCDRLKRAFEIGLSIKDLTTFHNSNQYIHKSLLAGTNLNLLRNFSQHQLRLMNENAQTTAMMYATLLNTTISTLINKDEKVESGQEREHISKNPEFQGGLNFHGAMKSFPLSL